MHLEKVSVHSNTLLHLFKNGDLLLIKAFGAVLTDLSQVFDCLPHELLLVKVYAYGFSLSSPSLVYSYLSKRKQRTKANENYSSWEEILFGVTKGSILQGTTRIILGRGSIQQYVDIRL